MSWKAAIRRESGASSYTPTVPPAGWSPGGWLQHLRKLAECRSVNPKRADELDAMIAAHTEWYRTHDT